MTGDELAGRVAERCVLLGLTVYVPESHGHSRGFPTLVIAGNGGLLFVLCKDAEEPLSRDEREWRDALTAAGAEFHIWRPEDLEHSSVGGILARL